MFKNCFRDSNKSKWALKRRVSDKCLLEGAPFLENSGFCYEDASSARIWHHTRPDRLYVGKSNEFSKWHYAKYTHIVSEHLSSPVHIKPFQIYPRSLAVCQDSDCVLLCSGLVFPGVGRVLCLVPLFTVFLRIALKCEQSSCSMQQSPFPHESFISLSVTAWMPSQNRSIYL